MIRDSIGKLLLLSIRSVLNKDKEIEESVAISWMRGFTKKAVLVALSIDLTYLLTSLIRFLILEIDNQECADGTREVPNRYVNSFLELGFNIELDEQEIIVKWPDRETKSIAVGEYISDDKIKTTSKP